MREANYWLKVISKTIDNEDKRMELDHLLDESEQLKRIFGSILQKTGK